MRGFDPKNEFDFLKNQKFIQWMECPTPEGNRYWEEWCAAHPDKIHFFHSAKNILQGIGWEENETMTPVEHQQVMEKLLAAEPKDIARYPSPGTLAKKPFFSWGRAIAAALVVLGMLVTGTAWWGGGTGETTPGPVSWSTYEVPRGIKKRVTLPDGSKVTLNSETRLKYPSNFKNNRKVKLCGQAFFEVERDPDHPFEIESGTLKTVVLGTSFDIKSYPEDKDIHVAVVTGKVRVQTPEGMATEMTPGIASFYDVRNQSLSTSTYVYEDLIGWKEKVLKFKRCSYSEVFHRLSRWYDVEFVVEEGVDTEGKFTAKFDNQSLANVLIGLTHSSDLSFDMEGNKVRVSQKERKKSLNN